MNRIRIGDKDIGDGCPCYVIAEAGSNHDGKLDQAKELIDVASRIGADAVKFQSFTANRLYNAKSSKETVELLSEIELRVEWHRELMDHAKRNGVEFLTSVFDENAADFLEDLGMPAFKIASAELNHIPLIRHVARKGKPVILSTGMAYEEEIRGAVNAVLEVGNEGVALLHCVSRYPTESEDVNIGKIRALRRSYACPVGFSDHTRGATAPIAAVALGANMIEKHFTLSRELKGPDHSYATEPDEFEDLIVQIRTVEEMMGSEELKPTNSELETRHHRRALYAATDISKGTSLREDMIAIVRPAPDGAILPKDIGRVIGRKTATDIKKGDLLTDGALD
jgi:N,N'-diacetyllegionaminate synthase